MNIRLLSFFLTCWFPRLPCGRGCQWRSGRRSRHRSGGCTGRAPGWCAAEWKPVSSQKFCLERMWRTNRAPSAGWNQSTYLCASDLALVLAEVWQSEWRLRVDERVVDVSLGGHKHQVTSNAVEKKSNFSFKFRVKTHKSKFKLHTPHLEMICTRCHLLRYAGARWRRLAVIVSMVTTVSNKERACWKSTHPPPLESCNTKSVKRWRCNPAGSTCFYRDIWLVRL